MDRYEEALADFNRAIELDEKDAGVIASRGRTYRLMERYEEALADFNRAIELDEKDAGVIASRGDTYRLMDRYEEALADYTSAIAIDPEYFNANLGLAACYRRLGFVDDYDRQISMMREMAAKESDYSRACFAAIRGDGDEAFALLRSALEKNEVSAHWVRHDPDFEWIRDDPRMAALLQETEKKP